METQPGVGEYGKDMERKPATYADLEALPPNRVGELIAGILYSSPRPALPHATTSSRLGGQLMNPFDRGWGGPGGWVLLDEPELHLAEDVLVPDLAGWLRERMPRPPRGASCALAPDWVCEVLSPSTKTLDRAHKLPVYAREGVRHIWLMDPLARTLEVLRLEGDQYLLRVTHRDLAPVHVEPFEELELHLDYLWDAKAEEDQR